MSNIKARGESFPYIIYFIIIFSFKFATEDYDNFIFWQPIIDNIIHFVLLLFIAVNSSKWNWISKRIVYSLILLLLVNTYATLFGMDVLNYINWYTIPLLSIAYVITIMTVFKIGCKLYILWKNGKI